MKNLHRFLTAAATLVALAPLGAFAQQTVSPYAGNGMTGFGGQIGNSSLTIANDATNPNQIDFTLTTTGFGGNALAIYLDTNGTAGGFNSTTNFTDTGDVGRETLSGRGSNGQTVATFAPGFTADYGISLEPGSFAGIFKLAENTSFTYVNSGNLDTNATTTLNFSVLRSDIGLSPTDGFTFEATLLSGTQYRSNETIGTSLTAPDPTNTGTAPNAGFTGTTTFSSFDTFGTPVPEPATWLAGGLLVAAAGWTASRSRRSVA